MSKGTVPKYRRQRGKKDDLAFVELNGRRHYLGEFGSEDSKDKYHRLIAEWVACGRQLSVSPNDITVTELAARYWQHAEAYYQNPNGKPTTEAANISRALKPVKKLYGSIRASEFGPKALKSVREKFIEQDLCRRSINKAIERIRRMFKWGGAEELVSASVYQALLAVEGLRKGRTKAREFRQIKPVPQKHINAIQPHISRQVWAIIQLQLLSAARSGELVIMRAVDLDMTGKIWTYTPTAHKTSYQGYQRVIYLGPRSQEILRPFLLNRSLNTFLFSPREAETERRAALNVHRKTPLSCGNAPGTNRKKNPKKKPGERYTIESYGRAIARACEKAKVPHWHPHRLRHSAGTSLRKEFGLEVARIILGHRSPAITELYAELDKEKALEVMEKIG